MSTFLRTICFLVAPNPGPHNDNHTRLPAKFADNGWQVDVHDHEALTLQDGRVLIGGADIQPDSLIWPLGFGSAATYLDRLQLLQMLPPHQFVVPPQAWTTLHGKPAWLRYGAPAVVTCDVDQLVNTVRRHGGQWVLKPCAGSFGNDVVLVDTDDDVRQFVTTRPNRFWVLQRYIPDITEGETRTLVCAGRLIGSYLRVPRQGFRANLQKDAQAAPTELAGPAQKIVDAVMRELTDQHVLYAAIDTVGGYLMEVNLANPGGLKTLTEIYGKDPAQQVVDAIEAHVPGET